MSLSVREQDGLVLFAVKAVPGASRDRIAGLYGEALKVQVAAPPEGGKANARICALLAAALGVPGRDVSITRGATAAHKTVAVRGATAADVRARLAGGA